ncbi:MAG: diadenylate cyclase [Rickettsiales bacterium]|jgi:diadenylate cyclase|nr:diadenylate cyclase [Rickettsiales bacterium]
MNQYLGSLNMWVKVAEVVIIISVALLFYQRFIAKTSSEKFVRGLLGLAAIWVSSFIFGWMGLNILAVFTRWAAMFLSVGLIVIFQPELRKFLGMMGQVKFLRALFMPHALIDASAREKRNGTINEIVKATEYMSAKHTGALMVFQNNLDGTIEKVGTILNADVSAELLMTIFFNKTPLHDGAVVISESKIISAGAILPLTENSDLNWRYGTRHRAAIGMSENSDAHVLVVSEESGEISIAHAGKIKKYDDVKKLRAELERIV